MNLKEFYTAHDLSTKGVKLRESEKQTYKGTDEKILYIELPKEVEGQDYLVCSRTLASKLRSKELKLGEARVQFDEDFGQYGLVCPSNSKVLYEEDL